MIKKAYRVKKTFPGLDKNIKQGDILIKKDEGLNFSYKLSENHWFLIEEYIYTTVDADDFPEYFEMINLKISYE